MKLTAASALLLLALTLPAAHAATSSEEVVIDAASLAQLEIRAVHADPRDQCFLYTELVHVYTQVASRQMAAGDTEQASVTLKRVRAFAAQIHMNLAKDTKKLKNAEILMHSATYRLGQIAHIVSTEDKAVVDTTLKQLDKVHDELLAQVFAH